MVIGARLIMTHKKTYVEIGDGEVCRKMPKCDFRNSDVKSEFYLFTPEIEKKLHEISKDLGFKISYTKAFVPQFDNEEWRKKNNITETYKYNTYPNSNGYYGAND